jgi:hypothetical protein
MRERRRHQSLRELRPVFRNARLQSARRRVAARVAALDEPSEDDALRWIVPASEFDEIDRRSLVR